MLSKRPNRGRGAPVTHNLPARQWCRSSSCTHPSGVYRHAYEDSIATQAGRRMPSTERNERQPKAGGSPRRGKPVVLLAEDNDDARRIYSLILRHYGYEVEEVTTGAEAVQATRSLLPSLVLMDIGLPEMDGWQASRVLKEGPTQ